MSTVYVVVMILLTLLSRLLVSPPPWVALLNIFTPLWFLPLTFLLPLTFFMRSALLRFATTALLLLFLLLFGSWFVPRASGKEGSGIRLVTFNHLVSNEDTERILAALRAHNADVIALQELSPAVAAALSTLEDTFPYQALEPHASTPYEFASGLGLLSRYPFEEGTYVFDSDRYFQRVVVRFDGGSVTLLNVHLPAPLDEISTILEKVPFSTVLRYNPDVRATALAKLLDVLAEVSGPLVVLGDFNLSDFEAPYSSVAGQLQNVYRTTEAGFGFTFPNQGRLAFPFLRIDHIWIKGGLVPIASGVDCRTTGSDHCLLWGDVTLR